jgi:prevent-host-death family protein
LLRIVTIHVNIAKAKAKLSRLIAATLRGEEVVIDRDGKPQVRLTPVPEAQQIEPRTKGPAKSTNCSREWMRFPIERMGAILCNGTKTARRYDRGRYVRPSRYRLQ